MFGFLKSAVGGAGAKGTGHEAGDATGQKENHPVEALPANQNGAANMCLICGKTVPKLPLHMQKLVPLLLPREMMIEPSATGASGQTQS